MFAGFIRLALSAMVCLALVTACGQVGQLQRYGPPDHVATGQADGLEPATRFDTGSTDRTGWLIGPNFSLVVAGYSVTDTVEAADASAYGFEGGPVQSVGDTEFFAAFIDPATTMPRGEVVAALLIDGTEVRLERLPGAGETVAAVIPDGAQVMLAVTDEQRTQRLNLRDGNRVDAVDGFYIGNPESREPDDYEAGGVAIADAGVGYVPVSRDISIGMEIATAERSPWSRDHGWAADGKVWLSVPISRMWTNAVWGFDTGDDSHEPKMFWQLKQQDLFSLKPADGDQVPAEGEQTFVAGEDSPYTGSSESDFEPAAVTLVFEVPAETVSAILEITPGGKLSAQWASIAGTGKWETKPESGEVSLTF